MGRCKEKLDEWNDRLTNMKCTQHGLQYIMLWCAVRVFRYVVTWNPPEHRSELRGLFMAPSQRDFNTGVRTIVEELDKNEGQ